MRMFLCYDRALGNSSQRDRKKVGKFLNNIGKFFNKMPSCFRDIRTKYPLSGSARF